MSHDHWRRSWYGLFNIYFVDAVNSKDRDSLVLALGNLCYTCRDFSDGEFDRAVKYIEDNGINLKVRYDGKPLISSVKTSYSNEDFAEAVSDLKWNFCDERIEDVKIIGKKISEVNRSAVNHNDIKDSGLEDKNKDTPNATVKIVIGAVAVVAVIAVIVAIIK